MPVQVTEKDGKKVFIPVYSSAPPTPTQAEAQKQYQELKKSGVSAIKAKQIITDQAKAEQRAAEVEQQELALAGGTSEDKSVSPPEKFSVKAGGVEYTRQGGAATLSVLPGWGATAIPYDYTVPEPEEGSYWVDKITGKEVKAGTVIPSGGGVYATPPKTEGYITSTGEPVSYLGKQEPYRTIYQPQLSGELEQFYTEAQARQPAIRAIINRIIPPKQSEENWVLTQNGVTKTLGAGRDEAIFGTVGRTLRTVGEEKGARMSLYLERQAKYKLGGMDPNVLFGTKSREVTISAGTLQYGKAVEKRVTVDVGIGVITGLTAGGPVGAVVGGGLALVGVGATALEVKRAKEETSNKTEFVERMTRFGVEAGTDIALIGGGSWIGTNLRPPLTLQNEVYGPQATEQIGKDITIQRQKITGTLARDEAQASATQKRINNFLYGKQTSKVTIDTTTMATRRPVTETRGAGTATTFAEITTETPRTSLFGKEKPPTITKKSYTIPSEFEYRILQPGETVPGIGGAMRKVITNEDLYAYSIVKSGDRIFLSETLKNPILNVPETMRITVERAPRPLVESIWTKTRFGKQQQVVVSTKDPLLRMFYDVNTRGTQLRRFTTIEIGGKTSFMGTYKQDTVFLKQQMGRNYPVEESGLGRLFLADSGFFEWKPTPKPSKSKPFKMTITTARVSYPEGISKLAIKPPEAFTGFWKPPKTVRPETGIPKQPGTMLEAITKVHQAGDIGVGIVAAPPPSPSSFSMRTPAPPAFYISPGASEIAQPNLFIAPEVPRTGGGFGERLLRVSAPISTPSFKSQFITGGIAPQARLQPNTQLKEIIQPNLQSQFRISASGTKQMNRMTPNIDQIEKQLQTQETPQMLKPTLQPEQKLTPTAFGSYWSPLYGVFKPPKLGGGAPGGGFLSTARKSLTSRRKYRYTPTILGILSGKRVKEPSEIALPLRIRYPIAKTRKKRKGVKK